MQSEELCKKWAFFASGFQGADWYKEKRSFV